MGLSYVGYDRMHHALHIERRDPADPDLHWARCEGHSIGIGNNGDPFQQALASQRSQIESWYLGIPFPAMSKYEYRIVLEQNTRTSVVVENVDMPETSG
jgi:hypothetical protein